jgi:SAM-dependent methyltransferase
VRVPTDTPAASLDFYQDDYSQGYTTDCPGPEELKKLIASGFASSERDYSRYIALLRRLNVPSGAKVLDFGCSWGYGVYQLIAAGYRAEGFEVSGPRGRYGLEQLKVPLSNRLEDVQGPFDVILTSHVLEHLPDYGPLKSLLATRLSPGGLFINVTPNGSDEYRQANYQSFHQLWGKVHPVLLNDKFVRRNYHEGLAMLQGWGPALEPDVTRSLAHWELMFVVRKPLTNG